MIDNNTAIKALSTKKKSKLTPLEAQQIEDLQLAYGTHNLISAIRFSKSAQIQDVAKMLLQHCGVRTVLPPSLKCVIPDRDVAEKTWPQDKFKVALRLSKATLSSEKEINNIVEKLLSYVKSNIKSCNFTSLFEYAIRKGVRSYGFDLVECGVQILPTETDISEEQLASLLNELLDVLSKRDWIAVEEMGFTTLSGVPYPISLRVNKYFWAKANRYPTDSEKSSLWSLQKEHSIDDIIHAMSCIPACEFSLHKLERLLTPRDLWEVYELDTEERIDRLFQQKRGRTPSQDERNSILHFLDETKTSWEDFYEAAENLKSTDFFTLDTVARYLSDLSAEREDEQDKEERHSFLTEQYHSLPRIPDEYNYDYSTNDELLESDDCLEDYDSET
jgi:hypothetical protein